MKKSPNSAKFVIIIRHGSPRNFAESQAIPHGKDGSKKHDRIPCRRNSVDTLISRLPLVYHVILYVTPGNKTKRERETNVFCVKLYQVTSPYTCVRRRLRINVYIKVKSPYTGVTRRWFVNIGLNPILLKKNI